MVRKKLATLPRTLNQAYERILLNIHEDYADYAKRFMKWLAYSARPLQLKELVELVTVEIAETPRVDPLRRFPDPEDVMTICPSLVTVKQSVSAPILHEDMGPYVTLAHFSVKEYLISMDIQTGPVKEYAVTKMDASNSITQTCLAYLLQFNAQPTLSPRAIAEFPLVLYAAEHWPSH